jgi:hypothetical protein
MYKYLNPIKYYNRAMMYYNQFLSWYLYERFGFVARISDGIELFYSCFSYRAISTV